VASLLGWAHKYSVLPYLDSIAGFTIFFVSLSPPSLLVHDFQPALFRLWGVQIAVLLPHPSQFIRNRALRSR